MQGCGQAGVWLIESYEMLFSTLGQCKPGDTGQLQPNFAMTFHILCMIL